MDELVGKTILHYRIHSVVGEGATGRVYKAQDIRLDRTVALKCISVSPDAAEDEKDTILQEAKTLSSLNHPNICAVHDIMEHDGMIFIIMEFMEGLTLRERASNLSIDEVLEIGIQAAEGLAAAHSKGIVHRDIKPENIMQRKDGIVQIMDFGLAKLEGKRDTVPRAHAAPVAGTVAYMSPEQVRGADVDFRSDIFSLGVVLYELLASEFPYKGVHEAAIMYEILNSEVEPLRSKRVDLEPDLERIIFECLEKDKEERYQSARELAKDLRRVRRGRKKNHQAGHVLVHDLPPKMTSLSALPEISDGTSAHAEVIERAGPERSPIAKRLSRRAIWWTSSLIFAVLGGILTVVVNKITATDLPGISASILQPSGASFDNSSGSNLAISPNGKYMAFVCKDSSGNDALYLRPVGSQSVSLLASADMEAYPFWSPDSNPIGYFHDGKLMKVAIDGGPPLAVCEAQDGAGGSWNRKGDIIFAGFSGGGIYEVPAGGGKPRLVMSPDTATGQLNFKWPWFLPDGEHFLVLVQYGRPRSATDGVFVVSLAGGEKRLPLNSSSNPEYSDGYLFFMGQSILLAQPFDPDRIELTGESAPIVSNVQEDNMVRSGSYSVSGKGILVYQEKASSRECIALVDGSGKTLDTLFSRPVFKTVVMSPDQKMVAFDSYDSEESNYDVSTYDLTRNVTTKLSLDTYADTHPVWSPDGREIVCSSNPRAWREYESLHREY